MIYFSIDDTEYGVRIHDEPVENSLPFTLVDGSTVYIGTPELAV